MCKKNSYFLVEGERACFEFVSLAFELIDCAICLEKYVYKIPQSIDIHVVSKDFFIKNSSTKSPQGIMFLAKKKKFYQPQFKGDFQVVLDRIQDPGNIGTILRTCAAIGVEEVILTKGCVDLYNVKVLRSSLSTIFSLNVTLGGNLREVVESKGRGKVWLSSPENGISCFSDGFNLLDSLIVFGNEANGIQDLSCGHQLSIPMPGKCESLNVAQAVSIILFEGVRKLGFFNKK